MLFFKHAHETTEADLQKITGSNNIFHKAYTILNQFYWTEDELRDYEDMNCVMMDNMAILEHKSNEGEARGIKKGRIEGEAIGVEKGKIEMAKQLLQNGVGIVK